MNILNIVISKLYYDGHEKTVERIGLLGVDICKEEYERPLVFSIDVTKNTYLKLPIESKVEIEVDWGEISLGDSETPLQPSRFNKFYSYKSSGEKVVRIFKNDNSGVGRFGYIGGITSLKPWTKDVVEIRTLGSVGVDSLEGCFAFLDKKIGLSHLDISKVKSLNSCFLNSKWSGNLDGWDTSKVEDIAFMFMYSRFDNNSIESWDVSNVNSSRQFFFECPIGSLSILIPSIDYRLQKWDLSTGLKSELYAPFYKVKF